MIRTMYVIYRHDSVNQPFVLRKENPAGRLVVMDEYQDLICPKCGKINEKIALARGIQAGVVVKSKRPFLGSYDFFYLVDERGKQVFSTVVPDQIDYYKIPSSNFYVASAKVWLEPEESNPGVEFARRRCKQCNRPGEVVWPRTNPLKVAHFQPFLSVNLEGGRGARETWVVSKEIADQLKKVSPPLTGICLSPTKVDDGQPV